MTTAPHPGEILLPSALERMQIFHLLKKHSSWTAWNRIFEFYRAWAGAAEESVREASEHGWSEITGVPESDYVLILKGLAHCEEGVQRLRRGDKRVFKFDANGEFAMANRMRSYWVQFKRRLEDGESAIDVDHTPHWQKFTQTLDALYVEWAAFSHFILETRHSDDPSKLPYGVWLQENLPKMHFPEPLPDVADPVENILVATGKLIPYSGIWEPVDVPKPKGFSLFRTPPPRGPFPVAGCMNYLHGGSAAPQASLETATDNPNVDAVWRLLWRDDRYEDGSIPEEEADYVFSQAASESAPASPNHAETGTDAIVWAESGAPASRSGRWLLQHDLHVSIQANAGDLLPRHQDQTVRWVLAVE